MRSVASLWIIALALVGLLAPLIANDAPIVARVDGTLRFPAWASYGGVASHGPDTESPVSWRQWWGSLEDDSADWAIMPPWPYGPLMERDLDHRNEAPSLQHPLGTDDLGRDLLARLIWGAASAFAIGAGAVLLAALIGIPLGAAAGYRGGLVDLVVSWLIEVFLCFPALFLVLTVAAFVGSSTLAVVLVLGVIYWTTFARLVRGEFLSLRERPFVYAARGLGVSGPSILFRHLLPQVLGPLRVNAAFLFASAVVVESTLAFLGLGAGSSGESWGTLLARGRDAAIDGVWHLWLFPAAAMVGTIWSLHALADPPRRRLSAVG